MAATITRGELLVENVSWNSYVALSDEFEGGGTRVLFDNGQLEIMVTSFEHEAVKSITAALLRVWAAFKDWPISGYGNVTLRRRDLLVGLEPDECYYVQTPPPPPVPGEADLTKYPPPDLAIEIDISRPSIDKISIYARLGIGEVWRWTNGRFVVLVLDEIGRYTEQPASRCLKDLPLDTLSSLVRHAIEHGQPAAVRRLRDLLQQQ